MARIFEGKRVILGVSGGIAAYKAIELARQLTLNGSQVDVMLTESAYQFVTPLAFQTLTRRPVHGAVFEGWSGEYHGHISLAEEADVFVVAPATANTIARLAHGLADDMLTVSALATPAPMVVAPAMDHYMYLHPATQDNLATLARRGVRLVGPDQGRLASGAQGHGRMVAPERLLASIRAALAVDGPLAGRTVVVSAGPTREPLDPIRYLSNRSSGKMGYAIAQAFLDAGASVRLVSGPTSLTPPPEASFVSVESAMEMAEAVQRLVSDADALVMAAAVGDYRPLEVAQEKIKKSGEDVELRLTRTTDILATVNRPGLIKVGFAAETTNLIDYARGKLSAKNLDLIVANNATGTMGSDESEAYFLEPGGNPQQVPKTAKGELSEILVDRVVELFERQSRNGHS